MKILTLKNAARLSSLLLAMAVAAVDYSVITDSYGAGAPYFGRSANMDKWQSPIFFLVLLNIAALMAIFALLRFRRRDG